MLIYQLTEEQIKRLIQLKFDLEKLGVEKAIDQLIDIAEAPDKYIGYDKEDC